MEKITCEVSVALSSSLRPKPGSSMSPCTALTLELILSPWWNIRLFNKLFLAIMSEVQILQEKKNSNRERENQNEEQQQYKQQHQH